MTLRSGNIKQISDQRIKDPKAAKIMMEGPGVPIVSGPVCWILPEEEEQDEV